MHDRRAFKKESMQLLPGNCSGGDNKKTISTEGIQSMLFYEYLNDVKAIEAMEKLRKAFSDDVIGKSACYD